MSKTDVERVRTGDCPPCEANTGAITYRLIDNEWHYTHWPKGIVSLVAYAQYKKENLDWEDEIVWKVCATL
jgi:hypothetical protein